MGAARWGVASPAAIGRGPLTTTGTCRAGGSVLAPWLVHGPALAAGRAKGRGPARRRDHRLLPQGRLRRDDRDPRWGRKDGASLLQRRSDGAPYRRRERATLVDPSGTASF